MAEALKWLTKAAGEGDPWSQLQLANWYAEGLGVSKNLEEAAKWYYQAANKGLAFAQYNMAYCYGKGEGVPKDLAEAVRWSRKAAEQGLASAQHELGIAYRAGEGVTKDLVEAASWYLKAAEQGDAGAQYDLGVAYSMGDGVPKDLAEAARWYGKAAEQGEAMAEARLGGAYFTGLGVRRDYVESYKWFNLSAAQGNANALKFLPTVEQSMTPDQIAEAQRLTREFKPRNARKQDATGSPAGVADSVPSATGTGFFITDDGFMMTNAHVVKGGARFRLVTSAGSIAAQVVKVDAANDLALLKAEGSFAPLPVTASRTVRLGSTVATVGFPNIGLQGFAPKLAKGEIAALSGAQDDARYFQISVPVQPGNSGGALVDDRGNVVGIVSAKLSAKAALATSGDLPENVNYAVKSGYLLGFLESVPDVAAKLKEPNTKDAKFEDVVKSAEQAAVLVLVY